MAGNCLTHIPAVFTVMLWPFASRSRRKSTVRIESAVYSQTHFHRSRRCKLAILKGATEDLIHSSKYETWRHTAPLEDIHPGCVTYPFPSVAVQVDYDDLRYSTCIRCQRHRSGIDERGIFFRLYGFDTMAVRVISAEHMD